MNTHAFTMQLKAGFEEEYKKRHDEIWPELEQLLQQAGVSDYFIFLDEETGILFGIQKQTDDYTDEELVNHPVMRKWWDYMADIMEVNDDHSPLVKPLKQVFYME